MAIFDLKPYRNGNKNICDLHYLNIIDKHRLIVPTYNATEIIADDFKKMVPSFDGFSGGGKIRFTHLKNNIILSQPIAFQNRNSKRSHKWGIQYECPFQPEFILVFGPESQCEGDEIIHKLNELKDEVSNALQQFEKARLKNHSSRRGTASSRDE